MNIKINHKQAYQLLKYNVLKKEFIIMAKGYSDDWDNYTELTTDDADNAKENMYTNYEIWRS